MGPGHVGEVMVHFLTHHHGRRLVAALKVAAGPGPPRGGEGGKSKPPHAVQRRCNDVRMCSRSGTPKIQIIKISPLSSAFAAKVDVFRLWVGGQQFLAQVRKRPDLWQYDEWAG